MRRVREFWTAPLVAWALWATPVRADDVADWAPPEPGGALVLRDPGLAAAALDLAEARFGADPGVRHAVDALRGLKIGSAQPLARKWGEGLALDRGVAVYSLGGQRVRLVLGADDAEKAKASLAALGQALGGDVQASAQGLQHGGESLTCALRGRFLICENGPVSDAAPGKPAWLGGGGVSADGALYLGGVGPMLAEVTDGSPVTGLHVGLTREGDTVRLRAAVLVPPAALGPGAALTGSGEAYGLDTVDARSAAMLKVSFDGPKLLAEVERAAPGALPPPVAPLFAALKDGWSGDLVVSFAGAFSHPVVALGLTRLEAALPLLEAVRSALQVAGVSVALSLPDTNGVGALTFDAPVEGGQRLALRVPFGVCGRALVLALAPADVMRCKGNTRLRVPPQAAPRGTHALVVSDPWALFASGLPWDLLQLEGGPARWLGPVTTLLNVYGHLVDELGGLVGMAEDGVHAEVWWRLL